MKLSGWKYPAVFDTETGKARYDNYGGHWGDSQHLDWFLQAYVWEAAGESSITDPQR